MSHRETDEDYDHVVAYLGPKWRVIECKDDLQWIVQERTGGQWRNRHYCTSGWGVERCTKDLPGWSEMARLPERYIPRARRRQTVMGASTGVPAAPDAPATGDAA